MRRASDRRSAPADRLSPPNPGPPPLRPAPAAPHRPSRSRRGWPEGCRPASHQSGRRWAPAPARGNGWATAAPAPRGRRGRRSVPPRAGAARHRRGSPRRRSARPSISNRVTRLRSSGGSETWVSASVASGSKFRSAFASTRGRPCRIQPVQRHGRAQRIAGAPPRRPQQQRAVLEARRAHRQNRARSFEHPHLSCRLEPGQQPCPPGLRQTVGEPVGVEPAGQRGSPTGHRALHRQPGLRHQARQTRAPGLGRLERQVAHRRIGQRAPPPPAGRHARPRPAAPPPTGFAAASRGHRPSRRPSGSEADPFLARLPAPGSGPGRQSPRSPLRSRASAGAGATRACGRSRSRHPQVQGAGSRPGTCAAPVRAAPRAAESTGSEARSAPEAARAR